MSLHRCRTALVLLILCLLTGSIAVAASKTIGTVVMLDGQRYERVQIAVDYQFKVVTVTSDEGNKKLSYSDIAAVYDEDGNDVTKKLLGFESRTRGQSSSGATPSGTSTDAAVAPTDSEFGTTRNLGRRVFTKTWDLAFRTAGNFSFPIGDYYDGFTSGLGYDADMLVAVSRDIALRGSVSRSGIRLDDPILKSAGVGVRVMRYSVGVQYYKTLRYGHPDKGFWYSWLGVGAVTHTATGSASYSETKFFTPFGFGVTPALKPWLGLDLSSSFDMIYVGTTSDGGSSRMQTALLFDLRVGLIFYILKHPTPDPKM